MAEPGNLKSQNDEASEKKKRCKKRGVILLVVGSLLAFGAMSTTQTMASSAEKTGAWSVPLICWLVGFFFFFKGGGKVF